MSAFRVARKSSSSPTGYVAQGAISVGGAVAASGTVEGLTYDRRKKQSKEQSKKAQRRGKWGKVLKQLKQGKSLKKVKEPKEQGAKR